MLQQVNQTEAGTSNGLVRPFRPWMSRAILPQPFTAVSGVGDSVRSMQRMRPGTPVPSNLATKEARLNCRRQPKSSKADGSGRSSPPK
jgi:hypothetical protein